MNMVTTQVKSEVQPGMLYCTQSQTNLEKPGGALSPDAIQGRNTDSQDQLHSFNHLNSSMNSGRWRILT